ncbi:MAG: translation initiation factor IF-2 [Chloroflexi bacterium]|nr:translation initiation factor IF-2 [Chloroflexota bacterium]
MVRTSKSGDTLYPAGKGQSNSSPSVKTPPIGVPSTLSVRQLADLLQVSAVDIIKQLMRNDIMANINQVIDYEAAVTVASGLGYKVCPKPQVTRKSASAISEIKKGQHLQGKELKGLKPRPPVVTIMGHVNHGKTRLLDAIRKTNIMAAEAGGITQHIGAYQVEVNGQRVTFLDTPGHEAFTAMRARGAQVTDIVILVVAADDGVMPQTLEAIDHAQAAGVPIVVAINKIDKPGVNPEMAKQQLADAGLLIEEWGGDIICVPVSAKERIGIPELLENLLVVAEMEELRANPSQPTLGVVIEAKLDKTKGPLATALVHEGTLRLGDTIVVGNTWGRVKAMFNDVGKRVRKAEPATPVEILGLSKIPQVGDVLTAVGGESQAQKLIQKRLAEKQQEPKPVNLSNLYAHISAGQVKELNIILKADVQGSIEPIRSSLQELGTEKVRVRVIHSGTGNITESDVMLAIASRGIIIGFGIGSQPGARRLAEREGISIHSYDVIYDLTNDVDNALKGMLEPSEVEVIEGRAEVRAIFTAGKKEKAAGIYVTEGKVSRGALVRLRRGKEVLAESTVSSLRRFKDNVKEVAAGYECGVGIKDFNEFQVGDILEFFRKEIQH